MSMEITHCFIPDSGGEIQLRITDSAGTQGAATLPLEAEKHLLELLVARAKCREGPA